MNSQGDAFEPAQLRALLVDVESQVADELARFRFGRLGLEHVNEVKLAPRDALREAASKAQLPASLKSVATTTTAAMQPPF